MLAYVQTSLLFIVDESRASCTINNKRDTICHDKVNIIAITAHVIFILN
ncbi:MAG: hypothetical protein LUQ04_10735 [Methanoregula sp.]|nr:hypothetical protein [Methanoregula sp.]